jgi:ATP-dependent Lon protease
MTQENDAVMVLPILPLKNTVLFPQLFIPLSVGRPQSVAAVEAAMATEEKTFIAVAQRDASVEQPGLDDLYTVGTQAVVKRAGRGENGLEIIVQGLERVAILKVEQTEPYLKASVRNSFRGKRKECHAALTRRRIRGRITRSACGRRLQLVAPTARHDGKSGLVSGFQRNLDAAVRF